MAYIRRKAKLVKDYFELTYRFGYVELLAASEFFGKGRKTYHPRILGSSVQKLPATITTSFQIISTKVIYISIERKESTCKNRIINQYYKPSEKNDWGFYSKRYEDNGFSPANPLLLESRQSSFFLCLHSKKKKRILLKFVIIHLLVHWNPPTSSTLN